MTFWLNISSQLYLLISIIFLCLFLEPILISTSSNSMEVGANNIWIQAQGDGFLNVVFISGNDNDSRVWAGIEPTIRGMKVRTIVYDRAGLGQSDLKPGPYHVEDETNALKEALDQNKNNGPIL